MRFTTTVLIAAACGMLSSALPTADADAVALENFSSSGLDIPVYDIEERDTENGTSIDITDAPACHIIAYTGDHCGGNIGDPLGIPHNNHGVCVGVGPSSGTPRHSYRITQACPRIKMFFYISNKCHGHRPHEKTVGAGCHNINTGNNVNSIRAVRA